jgi:glyoxylase-like metal-dependent hydrolase (beta-lactamase superfamily II)
MYNDSNYSVAFDNVGTMANPNPDHRWVTVPCYCVLIDHPTEGWILYDTGCAVDALETWPEGIMAATPYVKKNESDNLLYQLNLLGLEPKDINKVIFSHFHIDHAGNANLFAETAECYVSEKEAAYAFLNIHKSTDPATYGFYQKKDVTANFKKLNYVKKDMELFPGIEAFLEPGHTPGLMGLVIHLENQTLIFPMDQMNNRANYEGVPSGIVYDSLSFSSSWEKVKDLENKYDGKVIFSHDLEQFETLKKNPEYYS